jgi:FKBP-type peptidyl-prolyl cis-trans isomerase FkpA
MLKRTAIGICLILAAMTACNAGGKGGEGGAASEKLDADTSYAFGVLMGSDLKPFDLNFDYKGFSEGFKDFLEGKAKISDEEALPLVQGAINASITRKTEANLEAGVKFLEENALKNGVVTLPSGLQYEIVKEGDGPKPSATDKVRVNYEGKLIDDTVFDSSYDRGEPVEFQLDQVIPGWTEGLQLMNVGSRYKLYVPPALGYGDQPVGGGVIPANSVLIFDVELLDIVN